MLFYPLKTLRKFGVYHVLVVIDREGADEIIGMLGSGKEFGMDISYKVQEGAGGISEALYLAKSFVDPGDEIVCILGDNIFDNDSLDADFELQPDNLACVFVKEVSNPQDYGVAVVEDGRVSRIIEKPKEFVSDLGVVGLYVYTDQVFEIIEKIKPSDRGELEISSVNDFYASSGVLQHQIVSGYWGDAGGSIQRYAECNMHGAKEANVSAEEIDSFRSIVFDDK
jgi:glucose-1-phosphate thymidylyltransferase